MPTNAGFAFGSYKLDIHAKRLSRDGADVPLPARHFDLLTALVTRAGDTLTKDNLLQAGWSDVAVSDNSLNQAISRLRTALDPSNPTRYIETEARRGYRFIEPVTAFGPEPSSFDVDAFLSPHRIWIDGRAALESLERAQIDRARVLFADLVVRVPTDPAFHVGLANACALQYESTRADVEPDVDAIKLAEVHAREACRLRPEWAEAWATLGFVLERTGDRLNALAALRRSVALEPHNWRHQLRLSYGSWGEERLHAARRTLTLLPDCPLAHCLAATVYVARGALAEAEKEIDAGIAATRGIGGPPSRFSPVALHWLKGLLCLARGADDDGLAAFERELSLEPRGHLYARECAANTWYAIGAHRIARGDREGARAAFEETVARVPRHPMAHAGLSVLGVSTGSSAVAGSEEPTSPSVDLAFASAVALAARGGEADAAGVVGAALAAAPAGNAGWLLPVEPMLGVQKRPDIWVGALIELRNRAL